MNQKDRVLKYIKDFGSITAFQAVTDIGVLQLGARIDDLQKEGYTFKKEWHRAKNRYGENVDFKSYALIEENINHIPTID